MAVPDPCSASGATKPTLRCLACILSHLREKERVFTKFLCVAHCCRANRLRRSHRRQPQVRPARIARPSRSAVRKPPAVAAKCACRRRWRGAQHLAWEGRCEGHCVPASMHSLCCCVFHRYSQRANRSPVALRREKATCRGRQMRLPTALARRATPGLGRQMRREFAFPHQALALLLRVPQILAARESLARRTPP